MAQCKPYGLISYVTAQHISFLSVFEQAITCSSISTISTQLKFPHRFSHVCLHPSCKVFDTVVRL
jgi:hypothetical protein